jgi:hypothetical protein
MLDMSCPMEKRCNFSVIKYWVRVVVFFYPSQGFITENEVSFFFLRRSRNQYFVTENIKGFSPKKTGTQYFMNKNYKVYLRRSRIQDSITENDKRFFLRRGHTQYFD